MRSRLLLAAALPLVFVFTRSAPAQESGPWRAASSNAHAITGDIDFEPTKIAINFSAFTIAQIRSIQTQEVRALFNPDNPIGGGNLFRVDIPAEKRFLHKNSLCGSEDTQWIVTYAEGRTLQVAFFSGAAPPVLTVDALNDATNLCGVFSYIR